MSVPVICPCGDHKAYWKVSGHFKHLSELDLGHLTNVVKVLANRIANCPPENHARLETALDLVYLEISSRDQEITQLAGIGRALLGG